MHNNNNSNYHFKIEEREGKKLASMLAQAMTETGIVEPLKC